MLKYQELQRVIFVHVAAEESTSFLEFHYVKLALSSVLLSSQHQVVMSLQNITSYCGAKWTYSYCTYCVSL
jgi:hypothetical protein